MKIRYSSNWSFWVYIAFLSFSKQKKMSEFSESSGVLMEERPAEFRITGRSIRQPTHQHTFSSLTNLHSELPLFFTSSILNIVHSEDTYRPSSILTIPYSKQPPFWTPSIFDILHYCSMFISTAHPPFGKFTILNIFHSENTQFQIILHLDHTPF